MNILSVQSHVAFGHVGNSAAIFPMQRLGHEVWPIHTVQFSNHPGYGAFRGDVLPASLIDACVDGMDACGALAHCDAVLSGYAGTVESGEAILRAAARVRAANPAALYCCDPVIGDAEPGVFVRPGVAAFFSERAIRVADIVTPNHFELELLAGSRVRTVAELRTAIAHLHGAGPQVVVVTSLLLDDTPPDGIDLAVSDGAAVWRLRTPRLPINANGAGDAFAAMFLVHQLATRQPARALEAAAAAIFGILRKTAEARSRELLIVEAQDEIVAPSTLFAAERIA